MKNNRFDIERRKFLNFLGKSTLGLSISSGGMAVSGFLTSCNTLSKRKTSFESINYSDLDEVSLVDGLSYKVLIKWDQPINSSGERFGFNNDFLALFNLPESKNNIEYDEKLLCVNHEYPDSGFVADYWNDKAPKAKKQIELEMDSVGVSILHIRKKITTNQMSNLKSKWEVVNDSPWNRRITGRTKIPFAGDIQICGSRYAIGTLANCAGGVTPWGTFLTCEENYDSYYGEVQFKNGKRLHHTKEGYNWNAHFENPPEHYGWVVEINPANGECKKLTGLGRFAHESATAIKAKDGRCVVYSGDDASDQFLYKFISKTSTNLDYGDLYVANISMGKWILVDWSKSELLQKHFSNQIDVLIRTREAAMILGASPLDRPEDVEICPNTGAVYVSLTNNLKKGNYFGSILKLDEENGDHLSLNFKASNYLVGGEKSGFACPDNLAFDLAGNLWMTTDMPTEMMNSGKYAFHKNNGLFYIPMNGPNAGLCQLVAVAPKDAEFTGPTFSPDGKTLFLCVQHPGELTKSISACTSHWPDGGSSIPRSAVITIEGPFLNKTLGMN